MAGGFRFSIDFDSSQFKKGSDDAAESLDKLGRALEDVDGTDVDDATRSLEKLGEGSRDAGDDVDQLGQRGDDLARRFDESFDRTRRGADETGAAVRDSINDGLDGIDTEGPLTATQDLANEIKASLGETMGELAGSFADNGFNIEDTIDGVVEVAAEAAQALPGPWGLAGGAMIATAAGVYGEWKARMEAISERASEMYQDMIDSGADFLSDSYFQGRLQEFFDPMGESFEKNMSKIDLLEQLGVPTDTAARALAGYGDEADRVLALAGDGFEKLHDDIRGNAGAFDDLGFSGEQTLNGIINDINDSKKSADISRRAVDDYRNSIEEIPGAVDTDVDVDDNGSTAATQKKIDGVHGKSVSVDVIANTYSAEADLARLSQTYNGKKVYIDVEMRRTGGFYK